MFLPENLISHIHIYIIFTAFCYTFKNFVNFIGTNHYFQGSIDIFSSFQIQRFKFYIYSPLFILDLLTLL